MSLSSMSVKRLIQRIIHELGYELTSVSKKWEAWPGKIVSVSDLEFDEVFHRAEPNPGYTSKGIGVYGKISRCFTLKNLLLSVAPLKENVAECGTYRGRSAFVLAHYLKKTGFGKTSTFHLFDSWKGPSESDPIHDNLSVVRKGSFQATEEHVQAHLSEFEFVQTHKGWIPETFAAVSDKKFSFVHIDVNLYQPTFDSLNFFWPRLTIPGIIVFDDYGFRGSSGEKRAADEFCLERNLHPVYLPTGQAVLWRFYPD